MVETYPNHSQRPDSWQVPNGFGCTPYPFFSCIFGVGDTKLFQIKVLPCLRVREHVDWYRAAVEKVGNVDLGVQLFRKCISSYCSPQSNCVLARSCELGNCAPNASCTYMIARGEDSFPVMYELTSPIFPQCPNGSPGWRNPEFNIQQ